jgi:hypothetical protein
MSNPESISQFPEYLEKSAPRIGELMDAAVTAATERGSIATVLYRDVSPHEAEHHTVVDPVIQKTFSTLHSGEDVTGIGIMLEIDRGGETEKYIVSYGFTTWGNFDESEQVDPVVTYEIHEDGVTCHEDMPDATSRIDDPSGDPYERVVNFILSLGLAHETGFDILNNDEKYKLCQLLADYGIASDNPDRLRQAVQNGIQNVGTPVYKIKLAPTEPTGDTDEALEERFEHTEQVEVEVKQSGERTMTLLHFTYGDLLRVGLDVHNRLVLAESYRPDRMAIEEAFDEAVDLLALLESAQQQKEAEQFEKLTGFSLPTEKELNDHLAKIMSIVLG